AAFMHNRCPANLGAPCASPQAATRRPLPSTLYPKSLFDDEQDRERRVLKKRTDLTAPRFLPIVWPRLGGSRRTRPPARSALLVGEVFPTEDRFEDAFLVPHDE